jgi:predicted HTH transcriptional regulator
MYDDVAELLREIAAGEDTYLEFKEVRFQGDKVRFASEEGKATSAIAEVLVSLANTEGGVVLFGVNKAREIVGLEPERRDVLEQFVINCALNNCVPEIEPRLDWLLLPDADGVDHLCLKVEIDKSRFYVHQTVDGRFLKRVGSHRRLIPAEQLGRLLATRRLLAPFEERPAPGSRIEDLDLAKLDAYHRARFERPYAEAGLPLEQLLNNWKLAIQVEDRPWQLTNLGVLLFCDQPERFLAGTYVDIAVYAHETPDGNTVDAKRITGTVPEQIEKTLEYVLTSPYAAIRSTKSGMGRLDEPRYSPVALQESIVNALVHRDYELTGSQVIVYVFPDRIEVRNPGGLHNTLTPENLYAGCQPIRRNQHMAGFLRDFKSSRTGRAYMEMRGEGFLTVLRESRRLSGRWPELKVVGQSVWLTLFGASDEPSNV